MNIKKSESDNEKEKHDVPSKSKTEITDNQINVQPVLEQSVILEGKRSRKPTLRLEISESLPAKKELSIPQGHGKPLGEIEYINYQISHASTDALSRMRSICFGRRGNKATIRKNLREFKGFEFERDSNEYQKHLSNLIKLKKDQLRSISNIIGLPSTGRNTDHAERILNFLIEPIDEGKKIPEKKNQRLVIQKNVVNRLIQIKKQKNKKSKMVKMKSMDQIIILNPVNVHLMNRIQLIPNEKKVNQNQKKIIQMKKVNPIQLKM